MTGEASLREMIEFEILGCSIQKTQVSTVVPVSECSRHATDKYVTYMYLLEPEWSIR